MLIHKDPSRQELMFFNIEWGEPGLMCKGGSE